MSVRKRTWKTAAGEERQAWLCDYTGQSGKRHVKTFARKKDADAFIAKAKVEVREGVHTADSDSVTIRDAADLWLTASAARGLERATLAAYEQHARLHIVPLLGRVRLSRISAPAIREEIRAIVGALQGPWRPILLTAIFTGLRASELRGLRWADVDLKQGEIHVRQRADRYNAIGAPKSESGERTVPLPPIVANALRELKLTCQTAGGDIVFVSSRGHIRNHSNIVKYALIPAQIAAGVTKPDGTAKYTGLHALRHFYASWCINRTADGGLGLTPKLVQERLGHSTIGMTLDVYGHLFPRGDDGSELAAAEKSLLG